VGNVNHISYLGSPVFFTQQKNLNIFQLVYSSLGAGMGEWGCGGAGHSRPLVIQGNEYFDDHNPPSIHLH